MSDPVVPLSLARPDYGRSFGFAALAGVVLGIGLLVSYGVTQPDTMGMKPVVFIVGGPFFIGATIAHALVAAYIAGPISRTSSRLVYGAIFCAVVVPGSFFMTGLGGPAYVVFSVAVGIVGGILIGRAAPFSYEQQRLDADSVWPPSSPRP